MNPASEELTLTQILQDLQERGYTFDFGKESSDEFLRKVALAHQRRPIATGETSGESPQLTDLFVREYYRIEGMSDPSESCIVYAIETQDGVKGFLINAYGTYSEEKQVEKEAITPQQTDPENTYDNTKEIGNV
ncbi:MAG: hypothetical protein H7Y04_12120 [Verrucomicrobia bacterium]|nr:hypothetical protein [Cytophagales bacterium]